MPLRHCLPEPETGYRSYTAYIPACPAAAGTVVLASRKARKTLDRLIASRAAMSSGRRPARQVEHLAEPPPGRGSPSFIPTFALGGGDADLLPLQQQATLEAGD
jgi:hypothetical protein